MKLAYIPANILRGLLIYASGDSVAALLQNQFSVTRMLGMMVVGATIYAFEIPNYFKWIDKKQDSTSSVLNSLKRTALSLAYFSPLWIMRHLVFIKVFSGHAEAISLDLLRVASVSFAVNLPVSFSANYLIQNKIPLQHRFLASALFSAIMAVYYALAGNWFQ